MHKSWICCRKQHDAAGTFKQFKAITSNKKHSMHYIVLQYDTY